jgi:RimJ/RimL family protein N-acetyltransferase
VSRPPFTSIATDRLVLRRFRPEDAAPFAAYRSDPEIARYQSWDESYSIADAARFIAELTDAQPGTPGEWFQFAVADRATGALLGDCALRVDERDPTLAEVGYTLAPGQHGNGYATEAVGALVGYAFGTLGLERIHAIADERNAPSIRVAERLGFTVVARTHTTFKGERCVEETMELRRNADGG